eukprot:16290-Pelagococcus_subviridis.AAC.2
MSRILAMDRRARRRRAGRAPRVPVPSRAAGFVAVAAAAPRRRRGVHRRRSRRSIARLERDGVRGRDERRRRRRASPVRGYRREVVVLVVLRGPVRGGWERREVFVVAPVRARGPLVVRHRPRWSLARRSSITSVVSDRGRPVDG